MRVVVVGAGPIGLFCGLTLARRGHTVTVVDRDPGPPLVGSWARRGVMQFRHPHYFRPPVRQVLLEWLPDLWDAIVAAGGVPARLDGFPEGMTGPNCRRSTFERAVWTVAAAAPGLALRTGVARRVVTQAGRVGGVVVDGVVVEADLVLVAAGRGARLADRYRAPGEGGPCGFAYTARMYRALPGVEPPASPRPMVAVCRGYEAAVFPQDDRTFSVLIGRPAADAGLAALRRPACFDAAVRRIPQLAPWTDPDRFEPITEVMTGGLLTNTYRGQLDVEGNVAVAGLYFVGDAVSTTNPAAGRGISLGLRQAAALLAMLDHDRRDHRAVARQFDAWCADNVRPWFDDQVHRDAALLARYRGEAVDVDARLPSDVVCAAAEADPSLRLVVGPYLGMQALPDSLRRAEERVRGLLRCCGTTIPDRGTTTSCAS